MNCKICQLPLEISKQYPNYYGCPTSPKSVWSYKNHYLISKDYNREHFLIGDIFLSSYPDGFYIRDFSYYSTNKGFVFHSTFHLDLLKLQEYSEQIILSKIKAYQLYV